MEKLTKTKFGPLDLMETMTANASSPVPSSSCIHFFPENVAGHHQIVSRDLLSHKLEAFDQTKVKELFDKQTGMQRTNRLETMQWLEDAIGAELEVGVLLRKAFAQMATAAAPPS